MVPIGKVTSLMQWVHEPGTLVQMAAQALCLVVGSSSERGLGPDTEPVLSRRLHVQYLPLSPLHQSWIP